MSTVTQTPRAYAITLLEAVLRAGLTLDEASTTHSAR